MLESQRAAPTRVPNRHRTLTAALPPSPPAQMGGITFFAKSLSIEELSEVLTTGFRYAELVHGRIPFKAEQDDHQIITENLQHFADERDHEHTDAELAQEVRAAITRGLIADAGVPRDHVPDMNIAAEACSYPSYPRDSQTCFPIRNVTRTEAPSVGTTPYHALLNGVALNTTGSERGRMSFSSANSRSLVHAPYFEPTNFPSWQNTSMAIMLWLKVEAAGLLLHKYAHFNRSDDDCWVVIVGSSSVRLRYIFVTTDGLRQSHDAILQLPSVVTNTDGPTPFAQMRHWRCALRRPPRLSLACNASALISDHRHLAIVIDDSENELRGYLDGTLFGEVPIFLPTEGEHPGTPPRVANLDCPVESDSVVSFAPNMEIALQDLRMYTGELPSDAEIKAIADVGRTWCALHERQPQCEQTLPSATRAGLALT